MKTKKQLKIFLFFLLLLIPFSFALTNINNCYDLQQIENDMDEDYILTNNIDCSSTVLWNSGAGFDPIPRFSGELNGQNYAISNLFINRGDDIGLFNSSIGNIENLKLYNIDYIGTTSGLQMGGLVVLNYGDISNIEINGTIRALSGEAAFDVGGVVAQHLDGYIDRCIVDMHLNLTDCSATYVGGVAAATQSITAQIQKCAVNVLITANDITSSGGLVGSNEGIVINSYANVNMSYGGGSTDETGGAVGTNIGYVGNVYTTGDMTIWLSSSTDTVGGLIGLNHLGGALIHSFSTINLNYTIGYNGSAVGWNAENIFNSYAYNRSPMPCRGHYTGENDQCSLVNSISYFFDSSNEPMVLWDFDRVWNINSNTYPTLVFEGEAEIPDVEECPYPQIFCDDFNYGSSMYYTKDWILYNQDSSINTVFSPENNLINWDAAEPKSIGHEIERFDVSYPTSEGITTIQSLFAPLFANEFDITFYNNTFHKLDFKTFDLNNELCFVLRFLSDDMGTDVDIQFYNLTDGWSNLGAITHNTKHTVKVISKFTHLNKSYPFNTSFSSNFIEIFIDDGAYHLGFNTNFNNDCKNNFFPNFVKENSTSNLTIDNYYMYVGTDIYVDTLPFYTVPIYEAPTEEEEEISVSPITGTRDFKTVVDELWNQFGLITAGSKILFGLCLMFIFAIFIIAIFLTKHMSPNLGVVAFLEIIFMIMLTYLGLLPVWILIVMSIIAAGLGVVFVKYQGFD